MARQPVLTALLLVLATAAAASAQPSSGRASAKVPWGDLAPPANPRPSPSAASVGEPAVAVCGALLVPADPSIDPGIRVRPPAGVKHTLRVIKPPVCRPR